MKKMSRTKTRQSLIEDSDEDLDVSKKSSIFKEQRKISKSEQLQDQSKLTSNESSTYSFYSETESEDAYSHKECTWVKKTINSRSQANNSYQNLSHSSDSTEEGGVNMKYLNPDNQYPFPQNNQETLPIAKSLARPNSCKDHIQAMNRKKARLQANHVLNGNATNLSNSSDSSEDEALNSIFPNPSAYDQHSSLPNTQNTVVLDELLEYPYFYKDYSPVMKPTNSHVHSQQSLQEFSPSYAELNEASKHAISDEESQNMKNPKLQVKSRRASQEKSNALLDLDKVPKYPYFFKEHIRFMKSQKSRIPNKRLMSDIYEGVLDSDVLEDNSIIKSLKAQFKQSSQKGSQNPEHIHSYPTKNRFRLSHSYAPLKDSSPEHTLTSQDFDSLSNHSSATDEPDENVESKTPQDIAQPLQENVLLNCGKISKEHQRIKKSTKLQYHRENQLKEHRKDVVDLDSMFKDSHPYEEQIPVEKNLEQFKHMLEDNLQGATSKVFNVTKAENQIRNFQSSKIIKFRSKKKHKDDRPTPNKVYKCRKCQLTFDEKNLLVNHKKFHKDWKPNRCMECGALCHGRTALVAHTRVHSGEKPYSCEVCGKSFTVKWSLTRHYDIHSGVKRFTCDHCGTKFTRRANLQKHLFKHFGKKPYKCEECGKAFAEQKHLVSHARIHTGQKLYKCEKCEAEFSHKSMLLAHGFVHTGVKPFKCTLCSKSFTYLISLASHKLRHKGKKQHVCDLCAKKFYEKSALVSHMRQHTKEKPFKCDECHECFRHRLILKKHKELHRNA